MIKIINNKMANFPVMFMVNEGYSILPKIPKVMPGCPMLPGYLWGSEMTQTPRIHHYLVV